MSNVEYIFGMSAALAGVIQYIPYIRDILNGRTRPHAFSWFVWGLPCGIIFAAQVVEGAAAGAWATAVTTILCTFIFILSFFYGEKEIKLLDWICFALALLAVALWVITKNPLGSVILITIADMLGFAPTIRKSLKKPYDETLSTYAIGGLKWILSLFALKTLTFTICLYPIAMIIGNWLLVSLLLVRRSALTSAYKTI